MRIQTACCSHFLEIVMRRTCFLNLEESRFKPVSASPLCTVIRHFPFCLATSPDQNQSPFSRLVASIMASQPVNDQEHDEQQYLQLIRRVLDAGDVRPDRTGTGTIAIFAPPSLRFSLADSTLPLLTTKRTFMRGIVEELLWFIHGSTDSTILSKKGVKIWDGNGSKAFLEGRGLGHRREGDLGPVYGFQWRHFGAEYVDCEKDYTDQGVDQLRECIKKIKENPTDRRIILSAWNPKGPLTLYFASRTRLLTSYA